MKSILTEKQKLFLNLLARQSVIADKFYLSGGTALCEFYIPYRLSEDLDFFSEKEVNTGEIIAFLKSIKTKLDYCEYEYNTSFNRNLFFLKFSKQDLKLEFTYFPFPQVKKPQTKNGIKIDSFEDIAVNKLFTIYQKPRSRDFMDLYMIHKKQGISIVELIKKAKIKFDTHIDPIKLGSQFLLAKELKDYPRLLKPMAEEKWQDFFIGEAKKLGREIVEE